MDIVFNPDLPICYKFYLELVQSKREKLALLSDLFFMTAVIKFHRIKVFRTKKIPENSVTAVSSSL